MSTGDCQWPKQDGQAVHTWKHRDFQAPTLTSSVPFAVEKRGAGRGRCRCRGQHTLVYDFQRSGKNEGPLYDIFAPTKRKQILRGLNFFFNIMSTIFTQRELCLYQSTEWWMDGLVSLGGSWSFDWLGLHAITKSFTFNVITVYKHKYICMYI